MAGFRRPNPEGSHYPVIQDGTSCRAESPRPGCVGTNASSTEPSKRRVRVLSFDGAKVQALLLQVAMAEIDLDELKANRRAALHFNVASRRALDRAAVLYGNFLKASSRGPNYATAYLAGQHNRQRECLQQSLVILQSLQRQNSQDIELLAKIAFTAQAVKSLATVGVAIISVFLAVPEVILGSGIALAYDIVLELIKHLGPSHESDAETVLIGFKQTATNDTAALLAARSQVSLEMKGARLDKVLSYPLKSSVYRSSVRIARHLDVLLKGLGGLTALITFYSETVDSLHAYHQIPHTEPSH
jgi:hypothetical protein